MKRIFPILTLILCLISAGCSKTEFTYPAAVTNFVSLKTDLTGQAQTITRDDGVTFSLDNASAFTGLTPDSTYRVVALYEQLNGTTAHLYDMVQTFSPNPIDTWEGEIKRDPVQVQSIWMSGKYLNMELLIKAQNKPHTYHFIESKPDSMANITFYHDKGKDVEAYTQSGYFSIPLHKYQSKYDGVKFTINTFKGSKTYTFDFEE